MKKNVFQRKNSSFSCELDGNGTFFGQKGLVFPLFVFAKSFVRIPYYYMSKIVKKCTAVYFQLHCGACVVALQYKSLSTAVTFFALSQSYFSGSSSQQKMG